MQVQCSYVAGPYKGYCGRAEYDADAEIFHGEILGTEDVVTFQGKNVDELGQAFRDSVDDYLAMCAETGQPPEKPFSGKFVVRIPPELHRAASALAANAGKSLNQILCEALEATVRGTRPVPAKVKRKSVGSRTAAARLRAGKKRPLEHKV